MTIDKDRKEYLDKLFSKLLKEAFERFLLRIEIEARFGKLVIIKKKDEVL